VTLGCGGGVDSGGTGMTTSQVTVGPVSGFGSIVVGGIHHDESRAMIVDDDGQPLAPQALQLGTMTRIEGTPAVNTGKRRESKAQRVRVVERVVGPLDRVEPGGLGLVVLGQRVAVVPGTVLDAQLAAGLTAAPPGGVLAVFGQYDAAADRIVATRLEPRPLAVAYVVQARVSLYDRLARRVVLGGLEVDLSALAEADLPRSLSVGSLARAKLEPQRLAPAPWRAIALRPAKPELGDRDKVEIEGRITQFASPEQFGVDEIPVDARGAAFPKGQAGLALGARVEVEGWLAGGTLVARSVKLESDDELRSFEIEGVITALDAAAQSFVVRGITVSYAGAPRFEGGTAADLAPNVRVEVKGTLSAERTRLQAASIQIKR
jgi:hypothetical protein